MTITRKQRFGNSVVLFVDRFELWLCRIFNVRAPQHYTRRQKQHMLRFAQAGVATYGIEGAIRTKLMSELLKRLFALPDGDVPMATIEAFRDSILIDMEMQKQ
jgi:hypothetical protein